MFRSKTNSSWAECDTGRVSHTRSESSQYSRVSRLHSAVRDDAQTEDEYFRKLKVARYMEEEKERSSRAQLQSYEQDKWCKLRVKERADRLRYMSSEEIAELMRQEAAAAAGCGSIPRTKPRGPANPPDRRPAVAEGFLQPLSGQTAVKTASREVTVQAAARDQRIVAQERKIKVLELKLSTLVACQDEQTSLAQKQIRRDLLKEQQRIRQLEQELHQIQRNRMVEKRADPPVLDLRGDVQRLESELKAQRRQLDHVQKERDQLLKVLDETRDNRRANADQQRAKELEFKVMELQRKIQDSDSVVRELKSELQKLHEANRKERALNSSPMAELEAELQELKHRNMASAAVIKDMKNEINELHEAVKRHRRGAETANQEIENLQKQLLDRERRIGKGSGSSDAVRLEELERRQEEMRQMKREDARTIRELRNAVQSLEDQRSGEDDTTLPTENDLQARLEEMRRLKEEDVATIHRLLDERDDLREELEEARRHPANHDGGATEEDWEEARRQMEVNEKRVTEAEEMIRELQAKLQVVREKQSMGEEAELQRLQHENEELKGEVERLEGEKASLAEQVKELRDAAQKKSEDPPTPMEEQHPEEQEMEKAADPPSPASVSQDEPESRRSFPSGTLHAEEIVEPALRSAALSRISSETSSRRQREVGVLHAEECREREKASGCC